MEKHLDSMVMIARGASRNVRIYPLTVLFTFTMVIIINCILGLIKIKTVVARQQFKLLFITNQL